MSKSTKPPGTDSGETFQCDLTKDSAGAVSELKDTLFYDGQCPLCASEISQLRKTRGASLQIVDIHDLPDYPFRPSNPEDRAQEPSALSGGLSPEQLGPDKDQLLRVLHLRRADGVWLKSADANIAAWEGTRHGKMLRVLRWPVLRHIVDLAYTLWARWRYRRLYGAQFDESKHAPHQQ